MAGGGIVMVTTARQTKQILSEPNIVGRWYRVRGFGLGPFGEKWWVAPLSRDKITPMGMDEIPVTAHGIERIEVLDVTDGAARYRQYLINPDGEIVTVRFAPQYETIWSMPAGRLRGTIKRMKMEREHATTAEAPSGRRLPVSHSARSFHFQRTASSGESNTAEV
jgi:hypothetical protein